MEELKTVCFGREKMKKETLFIGMGALLPFLMAGKGSRARRFIDSQKAQQKFYELNGYQFKDLVALVTDAIMGTIATLGETDELFVFNPWLNLKGNEHTKEKDPLRQGLRYSVIPLFWLEKQKKNVGIPRFVTRDLPLNEFILNHGHFDRDWETLS